MEVKTQKKGGQIRVSLKKVILLTIAGAAVVFIAYTYYLVQATAPNPNRVIRWGVTFSQKFANDLGLDWKEAYRAIFSEINVKHIRLVAYWDLIEKKDNEFSFEDLDFEVTLAAQHSANIIITIGQRVPRWPECHFPDWTKSLTPQERQTKLLAYIEAVVKHYDRSPFILYWQVENEPFFPFGECPETQSNFLNREISLIKSLDHYHPILLTDSGEFGLWYSAANKGDVFGTTMYRRVYNKLFGYIDYHLPPAFFRLKELLMLSLIKKPTLFLVTELGAEPWLTKQLYETKPEEQFRYFDLDFFKDTIRYAKDTDFNTFYLWGVEWWYWLKEKQNHPEFWDFAKTIYAQNH